MKTKTTIQFKSGEIKVLYDKEQQDQLKESMLNAPKEEMPKAIKIMHKDAFLILNTNYIEYVERRKLENKPF
jgi:hypothetical protein